MKEVKKYIGYLKAPIDYVEIKSKDGKLTDVNFVDKKEYEENSNEVIQETKKQLEEYFKGERKEFDLPIHMEGTDFQRKVWKELIKIPYGKTLSYGEIAKNIDNPKASRAVGNANNKNKISIIIPCHRVIGTSGKLVGYGGGLWRKEWLLNHEKEN